MRVEPFARCPGLAARLARLAGGAAAGIAAGWLALAAPAAAATWRVFESAHFDLYTDAAPERAEEFLGSIEQFRAALAQRLRLRLPEDYRARVIMFTIADDFALFVPRVYAPVNVRGMALSNAVDPLFFGMLPLLQSDTDRERRVFFHEFTHLLYADANEPPPLWFSEGIAELFSTFRVEGDRCTFGSVVRDHLLHLRYQPRLPLAKLCAIKPGTPEFVEASSSGGFYPEAWAFVHFCTYGDPALTPKMMRFVKRQRAGATVSDELLEEAFGMKSAELERRFDAYIQSGTYYESNGPKPAEVPAHYAARELKEGERRAMLGALGVRAHEPKDPAAELRALIARWPDVFAPHVELAMEALRAGDRALAVDEFCRASELQPGNARLAAAAVQTLLDRTALTRGAAAALAPAELATLREICARTLRLRPGAESILDVLAQVEARAPVMDAGAVRQIEAAHARQALRARGVLALARIRRRQENAGAALQLTRSVLAMADAPPAVRSEAEALAAELAQASPAPPAADQPAETAAGVDAGSGN